MPENFNHNSEEHKQEIVSDKEEEQKAQIIKKDSKYHKKDIEDIESILNTPKEKWVEETRGLSVFNNLIFRLPGGRFFETGIVDEDKKTFLEKGQYTNRPDIKKRNLTSQEFFTLIRDALIDTGVDIEDMKKKNKKIPVLEIKVMDLQRKRESIHGFGSDSNMTDEEKKLRQEFYKITNELHYEAAPALLKFMKDGYSIGEFVS